MISLSKEKKKFSKLLFHPNFEHTISDIRNLKIKLPPNSQDVQADYGLLTYPDNGELVTTIEEIKTIKLDPEIGSKLCNHDLLISAYDESIKKFVCLEGIGYSTSHSIVVHDEFDFVPLNYLTFYFYTRSKSLSDNSDYIINTNEPETQSKRNYLEDRKQFLLNDVPSNSILFIDGPLIGGQTSHETIELNNSLLDKNIISIFFVKNSDSNLITDYMPGFKGKYNSDLHWAYNYLGVGERTNFFKYQDKYNKNHTKIFCYIKPFDCSPQRVEFHINTYQKYSDTISDILNAIFYLMLAQGDLRNPQLRPIYIAEKYARETLNIINIEKILKNLGLVPTINQERFAW